MEWSYPQILFFILPLIVVWLGLAIYSDRRKQRARTAFADQAMWGRLFPTPSTSRFWVKQIFRIAAITTGLIALAGPKFGTEIEQVVPRGSDLYVLIDVSRSMLAEDVAPSRLGRAQADVASLVNRLEGERIGLIAFAGQAVVKCPLTVDYDSFRRALQELDPNSAPRGGTAIGDAIRKSLEVFQSNAQRDQAILLITDGDDQQSYPLEAAATAAERKVTIFTVGLGDATQGARIPSKANAKDFVEYQGQQVWSKLDGSLLSNIAIKTSGVYIPAGTKSYDLGELYKDHLQGKIAADGKTQQRVRRSEQYQWFLAASLLLLIADLIFGVYPKSAVKVQIVEPAPTQSRPKVTVQAVKMMLCLVCVFSIAKADEPAKEPATQPAIEPSSAVRDGLQLYSQEKYSEAQAKFNVAVAELDKRRSEDAAIAAFDEACAYHRSGQLEKARERYLRAGLSKDRVIATSAHFNLGTLSAEQARTLAGAQPELVPLDKRKEITNHLMQAVAAYRHCLELQSDHGPARKNLELVRQWLKYYADKWREMDRQKRRDESNLQVFLEFLIQTQGELKANTQAISDRATADAFAELNRLQKELIEEIPVLKEKIENDLRPKDNSNQATANPGNNSPPSAEEKESVEEAIRLLQSWANAANEQMLAASRNLGLKKADEAAHAEQAAIDELDRIWDAIIPFMPLLAKDLSEQTAISDFLKPFTESVQDTGADSKISQDADVNNDPNRVGIGQATNEASAPETIEKAAPEPTENNPANESSRVNATVNDSQIETARIQEWIELQQRTMRRTRLLVPKAEMELAEVEKQLANAAQSPPAQNVEPKNSPAPQSANPLDPTTETGQENPQQVDPELVKDGLRKAIELAPKAAEQMDAAISSLKDQRPDKAWAAAETARRILEEIQTAQPKKEQKQDPNQEQDKDQHQKQDEKQKPDQGNDQKPDQENKQENQPQKDEQKSQDSKDPTDKQQQSSKPQVSKNRIEEALRMVREREQEKRDRDREMRIRTLGRAPVDKDW
jgi:Ca-activated chloride channel homolog